MGRQNNELAKKLWRISEIVCQQVKLWRFQGGRVGSMQAKELRKLTVTLTASRKLVCGTFLLSEPIWLRQRRN